MSTDGKLGTMVIVARHAERRMRLARAVAALPTVLTLGLGVSAVAIAVRKIFPYQMPESWTWAVIIGATLAVIATVAFAALRRLPPHAGALALDRCHDLDGRLTNAIEFSSMDATARTPLMNMAIEDACERARALSPRRAVRIIVPPELAVSLVAAAAVAGLAIFEVRTLSELRDPPRLGKMDALDMSPDDLELFREALEELKRNEQSADVKAAIEQFNQLIEDIDARRLNREEAFRKMQEIENDLLEGAEQDKKALDEALKDTAQELEKDDFMRPVADALKKNDLKAAQEEMKKVAEQMRDKNKKGKPSKAELERLKQALNRAVERKKEALEQLNERRAELKKELLKQKDKPKPKNKEEEDREKQLLKDKKRELERLDREVERKERAARRLSQLDRDLAKAAADLMRELGQSAEDMEKAAEDMNRLQQEQMSDKDKEELRRRLQELRELIRQQGQGGQKMRERLQRFMRQARGGKGLRPGQGEQGKGQGQGKGEGKDGMGEGEGEPGGIGIGKGLGQGVPIDMPGSGSGQGDGDKPGGQGSGEGGKEWGTGSGGDPKGNSTDMKADTHDVHAEGLDTGQGATNAEVILSAARRGFVGKGYKQVFRDYHTVAEDQIEREKIPDGMRFYVRRYFQLIRPRE